MKNLVMIVLAMWVGTSIAQQEKQDDIQVRFKHKAIQVEGTDALGAKVIVRYNLDRQKIYQERKEEGIMTFARFQYGKAIEYGIVYTENDKYRMWDADGE